VEELLVARCKKSEKQGKRRAWLSPAGQTKGQERNAQAVEEGTDILGRIIGMLSGCVGMGSGRPRHVWS